METIKLVVLEYKKGVFEGHEYATLLARYAGRVLKFKLAKGVPDLTRFIDKEVDATFEIEQGQNLSATLRITSVE